MERKFLPRLTMQQVRDLRRCHDHLVAADTALHNSSWAAAPAVRSLVGQVDLLIAELYNGAEPDFLAAQEAAYRRSLHGRIEARLAKDNPDQNPGTGQDEPEG